VGALKHCERALDLVTRCAQAARGPWTR
jgi:hypothetical protein